MEQPLDVPDEGQLGATLDDEFRRKTEQVTRGAQMARRFVAAMMAAAAVGLVAHIIGAHRLWDLTELWMLMVLIACLGTWNQAGTTINANRAALWQCERASRWRETARLLTAPETERPRASAAVTGDPFTGAKHRPDQVCDCPNPRPGRPFHCAAQ